MPSVKTAISLPEKLFEQAEALAREMKIPRSRLYTLAMGEFLHRRETQRFMEQMNAAWEVGLDEEEQQTLEAIRHLYAETLEPEEW